MLQKIKVPHTLVLLFIMMVLAQLATYILPQGEFDTKVDARGHTVVVPESYHEIENAERLEPWHIFTVIPRAFAETQEIIFFVFIIGGALAVLRATGMIDAFLGRLIHKYKKKPWLLIFFTMLVFSVGSSTLGMAEEFIPFVPVLLILCLSLKLDNITAIGVMVVGYGIGYGVAALNPFTVLVAQEIAQLKPTSGIFYRLCLFLPFFTVGFLHVYGYAKKVYRNPEKSYLESSPEIDLDLPDENTVIKRRDWFILVVIFLALLLIVFGISELSGWNWYLVELGAVFLAVTILVAVIARMSPDKTAIEFSNGATELTTTALLIGFARSIALILEDGIVLHTIVDSLASPLGKAGPELGAVGMYFIQSFINFFIPSGSGQAYVTMPLMTPIADIAGISRQVAVLAYQFGDGFTNMIVPTNAVLMGILGIGRIPYDKWFRFIFPLIVKLWLLGSLALILAVLIGYH
ncbi:MAG: YfcC family protein [Cyclobacteriaceae bacterium]|nr:YfcC family protein [Cyclobacteriaceae bacterium]